MEGGRNAPETQVTQQDIEAAQTLLSMQGGAPFQFTRRRGAPTAEAYAITQGPTLDHLRRRPPIFRTSRPRPLSPTLPVLPPVSPLLSLDPPPSPFSETPLYDPPPSPFSETPLYDPPQVAAAGEKRPKGSRSGYKYFVKKMRPVVKGSIPEEADKFAYNQKIMKEVGRRWRALTEAQKEGWKRAVAHRQPPERLPRTSQKIKTDPWEKDNVTVAELRRRNKEESQVYRRNSAKIKKVLRGVSGKTALRRASGRLKKWFKGTTGHWQTSDPLGSLISSLNKMQKGCSLIRDQHPTFLLTNADRAKWRQAMEDRAESEEFTLPPN